MSLYKVSMQQGPDLYVVALSFKDAIEYIEHFTRSYTIRAIELFSDNTLVSDKVVTKLH